MSWSKPGKAIRHEHPGLYHAIAVFALIKIALALNFWLSKPTFDPLDIPKNVVGTIFFVLGISQLACLVVLFLDVRSDVRLLRFVLSVSIGFMFFWGLASTQPFFQGRGSLQLPILYLGLCAAKVWWLMDDARRDHENEARYELEIFQRRLEIEREASSREEPAVHEPPADPK